MPTSDELLACFYTEVQLRLVDKIRILLKLLNQLKAIVFATVE